MREEKSREKKTAKASKFANQKVSWGTGSKHMCVAFFFHLYMRFERETDKKDGNLI